MLAHISQQEIEQPTARLLPRGGVKRYMQLEKMVCGGE